MPAKRFEREVLKLKPGFRVHSGHFYMLPVRRVLTGFAWERPPSGMYIWKYAFPMYDQRDSITLTLGDRLPHPDDFMGVANGREVELANEFVRRIASHEAEVAALGEPTNLAAHIEAHLPLANHWIRRAYALTLIVLGRGPEALSQLQLLLEDPHTARIPQFSGTINHIFRDLSVGIEVARETLTMWEAETKERLRIAE